MSGVLLWFTMTVYAVSASPCCNNSVMVLKDGMVHCSDDGDTPIAIYKWCDSFYLKSSENEPYFENEEKTKYSTDKETWTDLYCTGTIEYTDKGNNSEIPQQDVAMICSTPGDDEDTDHYFLYETCLLISCVFLFITLAIYIWLPELQDLQGKCVLCFILSLMIGYLCLVYLQLPYTSPGLDDKRCVVIAFMTYFWMMSAFFWLNLSSFNMWRTAVLAHINMSERRLIKAYYVVGWGFPLLFLAVALTTHHLPGDHIIRPNFGVHTCWFKENLELWSYFYGPVLFLLIFNIVYFISTALYLWSDYRNPNPMPRIRSLRVKFILYLKLFLTMGITWIFEIVSQIDEEPWYVTDVLNCLQGVVIFVVMIVLRKRVWRGIAAKRVCGLQFANCWRQEMEEESVNEVVEEQQL